MSDASKATGTAHSVSAAVTERLRAQILAGEFKPGERLYEVSLSERFGVSRTPVRSALQTLASDGLLEYAPNRGYAVRMFETTDIIEAYEIRAVLEGLAARRAAQIGLGDAARRALEDALSQGDRLLDRGYLVPEDRIAYGAINATIHHTIHAAGGTRMLGDTLRLSAQIAPAAHRNVIAFDYRDVRRRHDDHHRIFEAILCRDPGRTELLMRDHVESVKVALIRSMSATALSPDRIDVLSTELNHGPSDRRPESQPFPEF
jgi:GntR family transcriptional regulator of vanillate catabolism